MSLKKWWMAPALALLSFATYAQQLQEEVLPKWNMRVGATEIAREVYGLHMLIFWVCVVIAVVVFGAMFYSVFAHRRSRHPKPADFHESTTVEIIWTVIPFVILVAMAIPAAGTLIKMEDFSGSDLTVKVTGYQWMWQYEFPEQGVSLFSRLDDASNAARQRGSGIDPASVEHYLLNVDQPLVLPVGKKVRFLITANDVIHAWWVPALGMKKDAIPGFINEMWARIDEPGIYRGQCAELCGRDHGFMPIVVKAVPPAEFDRWLAQQKSGGGDVTATAQAMMQNTSETAEPVQVASAADAAPQAAGSDAKTGAAEMSKNALMKAGEKAYAANCAACHQAGGQGLPPTFPSLHGSALVKGPAEAQIKQVLNGKNAMPPMAYLSDTDIAAAITYERNSWGNDSGVVQPAQVAAARGQ